jgi:fermentation-respiration switch protein FrsA (DUF1100 family)
MRPFVVLAGLAACALALITLLLWWYQERVVFQPTPPPYPEVAGTRRLEYTSADGQPLFAYVVEPTTQAAGTLVVFHGNADLAAWRLPWARQAAAQTGWRIMVAEYRGYGGLPGVPTVAGVRLDALAAVAAARRLPGEDGASLALYGHSLGSAVAADAAGETKPAVLLLEAPFTSAAEMARRVVGPALVPLWHAVSRVPYDTRARVTALDVPVWVVHGERDGVIPARMGEAVYAAARMPGKLLVIPGADHNDVSDVGDVRYWEWLRQALGSVK